MKLAELKKVLNKKCHHWEEWHAGSARILLYGRDPSPRFDRKVEIFLDIPPHAVDLKKMQSFLALLDKLGHKKYSLPKGD